MGERIKKIRKEAGLTLDKFGERIGLKKASLSQIENGRNGASDQTIKMIAREFCVSEDWLRTGEGEMRTATVSGAAAEIAARLGLGPWATQALERFIALGPEEQRAFLETLEKLLGPASADREPTIDEKVESYRSELEAQEAFKKSSALQTGEEEEA
ncbi:MAG: helix-turn-helix transcriptional regulator [Lachnospiraceae bacterium]|nr:helix-turn-helix transcriptional regulator [Lachnospiraceae bacterium]